MRVFRVCFVAVCAAAAALAEGLSQRDSRTGTLAASAAGAGAPWPPRVLSWWLAPDNDWPSAVALIAPHAPALVTSVMSYCGHEVSPGGAVVGNLSSACAALFPALAALGVRNEIVLNSGNCDIAAYRRLWADAASGPAALLAAALAANASGVNIDLEPQADACKGGPTGTPADAVAYARWLAAVRAALAPAGIRLTADVASWSPVLAQTALLAPAVDRLLTMETYNGDSEAAWAGEYSAFVSALPAIADGGIGLGAWNGSTSGGASPWWMTPAAAAYKVARARKDGVVELAVFRIDAAPSPAWPLDFWWAALAAFMGEGGEAVA